MIVNAVEHRVADPRVDGGLAPSGTARADRYAPGEAAAVHLAIECGPAQARTFEYGGQPEYAILLIRHGGSCSIEREKGQEERDYAPICKVNIISLGISCSVSALA